MTVFLTVQQILFVHARLIDKTGGEHGLRELGLLQSAAARPQATFDGHDLYSDLFQKAAALMESLITNHPFVDGNKRTAIASVTLFLVQNGQHLQVTNKALEQFTFLVVNERPSIDEIANWFQNHSDQRG